MAAALLTNFLFWTGVSVGGVVFAALIDITGGTWPGELRVAAERFGRFLPISFAAFLLLIWRSADLYPWARASIDGAWFRPAVIAIRDGVALAAVYFCAFAFCRASERAREDAVRPATRAAVAFLIVYAVGFSLVAVDLVMSIEPRWTSTLFPAYVFTGNVYAGAAAVGALAAWTENGAAGPQGRSRIHDFANVMVAFALFWTYLFWSQFLVLWYGNVTAEIGFMTARIGTSRPLGWIVLVMCSAVPAIICVPQRGKTAAAVKLVAPIVLAGLWLEKWVLVVPDAPTRPSIVVTVLTTAIFAAAFWLSVHPVRAPSLEARQRGTSSYA